MDAPAKVGAIPPSYEAAANGLGAYLADINQDIEI